MWPFLMSPSMKTTSTPYEQINQTHSFFNSIIPFLMKRISVFLLLCLFALGCQDDDNANNPTGIQFRLENNTGVTLESASLKFNFSGASETYHNYGDLQNGLTTDYATYSAAGECSVDFFAINESTQDTLRSISICLCVCEIEDGLYTLNISSQDTSVVTDIVATIVEN